MNKNKLAPCIAFLLLTLFFGCSDFIDSFETEVNKAPEGMGYLSIRIDGAESSRTIMPTMPAAASLYYKLEFFVSGELTATKTDIVSYTDLSVPILLEAKTWDIAVSAYKDLAGTQIVTTREKITGIVITNSHITTVDVHLKPITEAGGGSGQGIFKLNIDYPGTVDFASMAFEKTTGGPVTTYYFTGGSPLIGKDASIEMDTGYYFVTFNLKIGVETLERKEILHIYQNLESVYNHTFTLSSFFATVTEITVAPESKSTYVIDEPLDLYVYAVYSDYTKSLISGGITTNYLSDTPGAQNITITHTDTGLQTTFAVTLLGYAAKIGSNNYPTLYQAVNDLAALTGNAASPTEIVILRDITAPENGMTAATGYTVPNGKHIKLTVESGNLIITASAGDFHLFSVTNTVSASSLTLGPTSGGGTLKLNGGNEAAQPNRNGVYVYYASNNGSSFTMNNGVTITGFKSGSSIGGGGVYLNNGTFTMNGGEISGNTATTTGGGVYSNYSFTMKGGKISGNSTTNTASNSGNGGGVYMTSSASNFSMNNSSEISGNTATGNGGGVYINSGNFTISDSGKISGNNAKSGGGVFVNDAGSIFTMSGGEISSDNNTTNSGGGVYINNGKFDMSGGKISGNTTTASGGGVYVAASGTFDMSGGTIGVTATDKNSATSSGGGVYVASGKFTMRGTAKISGNTANTFGGGVYVAGTSTGTNDNFTMSDNTQITGNTAPSGGGVYISTEGKFTMSGGTIGGTAAGDKNTATSNGGGVCIDSTSGTFKMTGGKISGNTANASGGGVSTNSGTFNMIDGEISGNKTEGTSNGGGGVYVGSNGKFTLSGNGKISGNTAPNGGGVYAASNGTNYFTMSGGEISGNKANTNGGGVFVITGKFTISGGTIYGTNESNASLRNTASSSSSSGAAVYVNTSATAQCDGAYAGGLYSPDNKITTTNNTVPGYITAKIDSKGYYTLNAAINDAANGNLSVPTEIIILRDITAPEGGMAANTGFTIPENKHIKLTGEAGENRTITASAGDFRLFSVSNSNSSLTLKPTGDGTLTLDGINAAAGANRNGVYVASANRSFTMYDGVTITGFKNSSFGGGVYVDVSSTFTMNGGNIKGNSPIDVYVSQSNSGSSTLSGNAVIGKLCLNFNINIFSTTSQMAVTSGWTGSVENLSFQGSSTEILAVLSAIAGARVLKAADGYTLQASDVAKFTLGSFFGSSPTTTQLIDPSWRLEDTGADIGKIMPPSYTLVTTGSGVTETTVITGIITTTQLENIMKTITTPILDLSGATTGLLVNSQLANWLPALKKIILPDNVPLIGSSFFQASRYLEEIEISPSNTFYKTIDGVLYKLSNNVITQLVYYPAARNGYSDSVEFTVPATVTSLDYCAFSRSQNIKKIILVRDVTLSSMCCFQYSSVEEIIGDTYITNVRYYSFEGSNLKHITLNIATGFDGELFRNCTSLEWVALPNAVTPKVLTYFASRSPHDFAGCTSLTAVYVPDDSVNAYREQINDANNAGWKILNEMRRPAISDIIQPISSKP